MKLYGFLCFAIGVLFLADDACGYGFTRLGLPIRCFIVNPYAVVTQVPVPTTTTTTTTTVAEIVPRGNNQTTTVQPPTAAQPTSAPPDPAPPADGAK